ncbi:MAG: AAA family ATPase, partial [Oscillospiraceae bacterium]|nr:AAA family ATPase [Oscillospiraceae bacterium]
MLKFILGGAGYGKSTMLIDTINELSDTDKKIIFIVPEQFSFESDKKIYKKLGAEKFNKILSLSFTSLAKEIFEKYGGRSGEYAEDIHKVILMNKTVRELVNIKAFQYYEKQANKPGFVSDALSIVNEFRQCGISPDELISVCNSHYDCSEKMNDLSMIYTTYDRMMTDADLKDSLTDISEAAAVANMNDYFKDSIIVIDEFESFTGDQYELIDTMFAQAEDIYIA